MKLVASPRLANKTSAEKKPGEEKGGEKKKGEGSVGDVGGYPSVIISLEGGEGESCVRISALRC